MIRPTLTLIALLLAGAAAAAAGTFTVTLTNGTSFETRYRPSPAAWDESLILLYTDRGNQIALLEDEIADVTSSVEESGFGYQLDTTTLFVGWSPNVEDEEAEGEGAPGQAGAPGGPAAAAPLQSFTVEQFVNPDSTSGANLPVYTGYGPEGN